VADPDGAVRVLSDLPGCMDGTNAPAWSPDSRWILFQVDPTPTDQSCEPADMDVYVVSVDGGEAHRLLAANQTIHTSSPDWAGDRIVMRGFDGSNAQLLVATVSDPAQPWNVTAQRIDSGVGDVAAFGNSRWSPDGSEIATTYINAGTGSGTAMVIPGEGGTAISLLRDPTKDQIVPAWSPDGTWLTVLEFTKELTDHGIYHLVRVDRDGSNARVIPTVDLNGNGGPAVISPDGTTAAARLSSTDSAVPDSLELIDLVGNAPTIQPGPAGAWSAVSWQPVANPNNPAANAPLGEPAYPCRPDCSMSPPPSH
jgi:Tol biopolymer transport system component